MFLRSLFRSFLALPPCARALTFPPLSRLARSQHSGKYTDLAQDIDGNYGGRDGAQRILSGGGASTTTGGPSMAGSPARTGPGPDLGGPPPGMHQPQMTSVEQGRVGESA